MKKMFSNLITVVIFMVTVVTTRGGAYDRRCGTQPREQGFEEDEAHLKRLMKTSDVDENIVINTYFHVISSGDLEDEDEIPDHRLYSQLEVLNNDYNHSNIQFDLQKIQWVRNKSWWDIN